MTATNAAMAPKSSQVYRAVDTLRCGLTVHVRPANEPEPKKSISYAKPYGRQRREHSVGRARLEGAKSEAGCCAKRYCLGGGETCPSPKRVGITVPRWSG